MDPLGSTAGGLEGPSSLGAEQTLGLDAQSAGPTQPVALRHLQDAVAGLQEGKAVTISSLRNKTKQNINPIKHK